jgi:hypothetical protein
MPFFDDIYADKLRGGLGLADAESVLDLRGTKPDKAAHSIEDMLQRSRFAAPKTVAIRLDPPPEGGGETAFLPVGRRLLEAKRQGWIGRLQTLPARDGLGFYVGLSGKPQAE